MIKTMKIDPARVQDTMQNSIGETGTVQSLRMLVKALEESSPGDKLLVISFGSGCDALYFEVTERIARRKGRPGVQGHLACERI